MALKPFNSVAGFSIGKNTTTVVLANGDVVANNLNVTGKSLLGNVGNVIITGGLPGQYLRTDGNGNLIFDTVDSSVIANGNSSIQVLSNGNVLVNVSGVPNVLTVTNAGINVIGNSNLGNNVTSNTFTGVLTTNAQPNITSVGTLLGLNVDGNITAANITANTGVFIGNGSGLSALNASNISTGTLDQTRLANSNIILGSTTLTLGTTTTTVDGLVSLTSTNLVGTTANLTTINSGLIQNGNSNVTIDANANVTINAAGVARITATSTGANITGTLGVSGNANVGNIGATLGVFTNIAGEGGNISNIQGANVSGTVASATTAGTVTTNAQPNITSVGSLTGLTVAGNANVGNLGTAQVLATANVIAPQLISNVATGTAPLSVQSTTVVANLNADLLDGFNTSTANTANTVAVRDSNGNVFANFFIGNGSQLTGIDATLISNGSANVRTFANANVSISAAGNANIVVVTGTGVNVAGTLNATGNANVGNLGTGRVIATGNISGTQLISNIATGTAPIVVTSTTRVANLNVNYANVADFINVSTQSSGSAFLVFANALTGNVSETANAAFVANTSNGALFATTFVGSLSGAATTAGTVTTNAQPNITSVGTLSALSVTGNVAAGNLTTTGVLSVTGTGVSSIAGNLDMTGNNIINLATPINDGDAVTKLYVDNLVSSGIHYHEPVRVESPTPLNATYNNGSSGVGATLTNAGTNAALVIDGISLNVADRVLVYQQTNQTHNGVYVVTTVGDGSTPWVLTRSSDTDTYAPSSSTGLDEGSYFFVKEGVTGAGESYVVSTVGTIVFGTTNITFAQFGQAPVYIAGTGLTLTNTTFSVNTAQPTITSVGTLTGLDVNGNIVAANITANTGVFTGNGSGLTNLNASNLSTGTIPNARLSGNYTINVSGTATTVTANAQPNITSVGTLTGLNVNGNIVAANITANTGVFSGNGSGLTNLPGANVTGQVANALVAGTVYSNSQPNITSVGTLSNLTVTGNVDSGNLNTGNANLTGNLLVGNGTGGTLLGANLVSANFFTGTLTTNAQPNITSVGTMTGLNVNGNITAANITANTGVFTGNGSGLSALNASNLASGTVPNARLSGNYTINVSGSATTVTANAQPNITSVGTLTGLTVAGNVTANNFIGMLANGTSDVNIPTSNGNIVFDVSGNSNVVVVTGTGLNVNGTLGTTGNAVVSNLTVGNGTGGTIAGANLMLANFFTGTLTTNAQPNITSVGTLTSLNVTGNVGIGTDASTSKLVIADTLTANASSTLQINPTWNAAANTFTAVDVNVTDTASNAASLLMNLRVGGASRFSVGKAGNAVAPNGSAATPAYAMGSNATGIYSRAPTLRLNFAISGFDAGVELGAGLVALASTSQLAWVANTLSGSSLDLFVGRDAANTLAQRNGANAQTSRIYGTFTDASNYERGFLSADSNGFNIGHEALGTGTKRPVRIIGSSLTSAEAVSALQLAQTWNTTGTPTAIDLNVTDTASNAASLLMDLRVGGVSQFSVDKTGSARSVVRFIAPNMVASTYSVGTSQRNSPIFSSTALRLDPNMPISWAATNNSTTADLILLRDAANTLALRNGTNPQAFNIYNTFTDTSNYERGFLSADSNGFNIGHEALGTGTKRPVRIIGSSLTSAEAVSALQIAQTWNTTGTPTAFQLEVTDTASNAASLLMDLRVGGTSRLSIGKSGLISALNMPNPSVLLGILGTPYVQISATSSPVLVLGSAGLLAWRNVAATNSGANDLIIGRDAANTLAQRNGANAQTSRIYGTFTDASNYERLSLSANSIASYVMSEQAGTGTARPLYLGANNNVHLAITTSGNVGIANTAPTHTLSVTGTMNVSGNANVGNIGTEQVIATANITAPQLISNVATGTAPLVVTSTTRVANLNVAQANVSDFITVSAGTGNNFLVFANVATGNAAEVTSTGLTANLSNNSITATTFVGALSGAATTVTANAQPNITSVGNLTALNVTGNVSAGNLTTGPGTGGSITGANLIAANSISGTIITSAQPNITSVGNLTSLNVIGNVTAGNFVGAFANGNSDILIPVANGNIVFDVAGTANVAVMSNTGLTVANVATVLGNVSIGTNATPTQRLDVSGSTRTFGLVSNQLGVPATLTGTGSTTGGTLAAATYFFVIVAVDGQGNLSSPSNQSVGTTTTGSTSSIQVSWAVTPGAVSYRIYFATTSLAQASYFTSTTNSFNMTTTTGAISGFPPASDNTGTVVVGNAATSTVSLVSGIQPTITMVPTGNANANVAMSTSSNASFAISGSNTGQMLVLTDITSNTLFMVGNTTGVTLMAARSNNNVDINPYIGNTTVGIYSNNPQLVVGTPTNNNSNVIIGGALYNYMVANTTGTSAVVIDTYNANTFAAGDYLIQVSANGNYQSSTFKVITNGSNISSVELGKVFTSATALANYTATLSGNVVQVNAIPSVSGSTFKIVKTMIGV